MSRSGNNSTPKRSRALDLTANTARRPSRVPSPTISDTDDVDVLRERIKKLEAGQQKTDEQVVEIERLRKRVRTLEEENAKLIAEKAALEAIIRQQGGDSGILEAIQDCYARIDIRFDLTETAVQNPNNATNKKVRKQINDLLHKYDWGGGKKPTDAKCDEMLNSFFEMVLADKGERQKRIDKKTRSRQAACKAIMEALEKNPNMREPPLTVKQLKTVAPALRAAYTSSDEEVVEEDEVTNERKLLLKTKKLSWESDDYCVAKVKLDSYYNRILNPSRKGASILPIKDGSSELSRRRAPPGAPKIVTEGWC